MPELLWIYIVQMSPIGKLQSLEAIGLVPSHPVPFLAAICRVVMSRLYHCLEGLSSVIYPTSTTVYIVLYL